MKKVALALLVVLTISSVSFAGWVPVITRVDTGSTTVATFTVGLQVDDANGITSVSDVSILDAVQVSAMGQPTADWKFLAFLGDNAKYDTHLLDLSSYGTGIQEAGNGWTETNDGSNPAGIGAGCGMGDISIKSDASTVAIKNPPVGLNMIEFAQVVIPMDGLATVSGLYTNPVDAQAQVAMVPFSFTVAVPEPSTIVMLVLGALCLVGARLRRK